MKLIDFKNFFKKKFFTEDRKYIHLNMRSMLEHARPFDAQKDIWATATGDVQRIPVLIDEDDIEFLQQFPPELWSRALYERYNDLHEFLIERENYWKPIYENLFEKIKKSLLAQNFSTLKRLIKKENTIELIKRHYGKEWHREYVEEGNNKLEIAANNAAKSITYYILEEEYPYEHNDNPKNYEFTIQGRGKRIIKAKPFINRLVHKLGRTIGAEHDPNIGLAHERGRYGYDLHDPKKGLIDNNMPNSTQGMQMPNLETIVDRIKDFLATNAHQIYGDLPQSGEEVELPSGEKVRVQGFSPVRSGKGGRRGGQHSQDTFIKDEMRDPLIQKYYTLLKLANGPFRLLNGKEINPIKFDLSRANKILSLARKLAQEDIDWIKKNGSVYGPPIPGHNEHPNGIPFKELQIVHLPHFKKEITEVKKDGTEFRTKVDMPYVFPAQYFRLIGTLDTDFEKDDDGKIIIDDRGQPIIAIPEEERTGYRKNYVIVRPEEYEIIQRMTKNKGIYSSGALSLNKNTSASTPLEYGHKDYKEKMKFIFENMKSKKSKEGNDLYDDILTGIKRCLKSEKCGEATNWQRQIALDSIEEIHQIIVQKMLMNLNDPALLDSNGRINFSKTKTSLIMQQDYQGSRSRRLRILNPAIRDISKDSETNDGDSPTSNQSIIDKSKIDITSYRNAYGNIKNRREIAGSHQFPYDIRNLRNLIDLLKQEAIDADRQSDIAKKSTSIGEEIIKLLKDSIIKKNEVGAKIYEIIIKMIQASYGNLSDDEIEKKANEILKEIIKEEETTTSQELLNNFLNHNLTKKYYDIDEDGINNDLNRKIKDALSEFYEYISYLQKDENGNFILNDKLEKNLFPQNDAKLSTVALIIAKKFASDDDEEEIQKIANIIQNKIYELFKAKKQQINPQRPIPIGYQAPTSIAAKVVQTLPAKERAKKEEFNVLMANKDYLALAFHQNLSIFNINSLNKLKERILSNEDYDKESDEVKEAILNINRKINIIELAERMKKNG